MAFPRGGDVGAGREFSDVGRGMEWCGKQSAAGPWALGGSGLRKKSEKERRAAGGSKKEERPAAAERRKSGERWLAKGLAAMLNPKAYFFITLI